MNQGTHPRDTLQPVNLLPILRQYLANLRLAVPIFAFFVFGALTYFVLAKQLDVLTYTASATVGPPDADSLSNPANFQLPGGASLLSSALSGKLNSANPVFDEYLQLLNSVRLADVIVRNRPDILQKVFYKKWDPVQKQWKPRTDLYHATIDFLKCIFHVPTHPVPNADDFFDFLQENLRVSTPYTTSFATISLDFHDKDQATEILKALLAEADTLVREEKRSDVRARIEYLQRILPLATASDQREALISALSKQLQMMSFIAADTRFASMVIDPPHTPEKPTSPNLALCIIVALIFGSISWSVLIFSPMRRLSNLLRVKTV